MNYLIQFVKIQTCTALPEKQNKQKLFYARGNNRGSDISVIFFKIRGREWDTTKNASIK